MTTRTLVQIIASIPTSDGAGVKLRRSLGSQRGLVRGSVPDAR